MRHQEFRRLQLTRESTVAAHHRIRKSHNRTRQATGWGARPPPRCPAGGSQPTPGPWPPSIVARPVPGHQHTGGRPAMEMGYLPSAGPEPPTPTATDATRRPPCSATAVTFPRLTKFQREKAAKASSSARCAHTKHLPLISQRKGQRPVRLAYQPPASSTFFSEEISHQQSANSTFLSKQTSTSHQPPANRTCCCKPSRKSGSHRLALTLPQ
jgi:hypothetical protein